MQKITLELSQAEANSLREKLEWLMREANGVDIWLAPGGEVDLEGPNAAACFLDCDEEAHFNLGNILTKLGGSFTPHRDENFKG